MADSEDLRKRPTSLHATMKQGGAQGSALERLNKASAIKKNRSPASNGDIPLPSPTHSTGEADYEPNFSRADDDEATDGGAGDQKISFDDMFTQVDSEDEDEFDIVNPLYEHAGGGGRFRTGTLRPQEVGYSIKRFAGMFKFKSKTPTGRVEIVPIKATGLASPTKSGNSFSVRVRASINGQSASTPPGACTPGPNPEFQKFSALSVLYFKADTDPDDPLQTQDVGELQIEVNDAADDSFIGAASVTDITKFSKTKRVILELASEQGTSAAGTLEVEITYHASTFLDIVGLRGKWIIEYPKRVGMSLKNGVEGIPHATKRFLEAGLPGLSGGAGSWVIVAVCCIPYIIVTLTTNWSWATRQWVLFVPLYWYFFLSWPVIFGWLFGTLITTFALHGYPGALKVPTLHVQPWIRNWRLHVRVWAEDTAFGNPPGFPLENFAECQRVDVKGSVTLRHLWDVVTLNYKKCPLKKVPDFRLLAKFDIDYIEFENVMVDMQMYNGRFNIHEYSGMLAEGQARNTAWFKGYMKSGDPTPNELEIRIIRAKNLVKTRTSKRTLRQLAKDASAQVGQFGRNAVVDAFKERSDSFADSEDEEEEAAAAAAADSAGGTGETSKRSSTSGAPVYGGGGPPQFNIMDATVKEKKVQGHFDPYVVVTLRRDVQKTHTQTKTNSPMWNETFYFHAPDAATVVHVQVFNRELGGDVMLGQWVMTLKWMLGDPYYCWHEKGMEVTPDRWMRGWFPLMNKNFRGVGKCGKIEMAMQWRYVPEAKLKRKVEFPPLTALQQLQENSTETRLRMGDMARVKYWLNHEPVLYDIRRVTVRGIRFYVQDLFRGYTGRAEKKGVERSNHVEIARLDYLTEFRPRHKGDLGITTYKVVYHFFRGVAPKVLDSASSNAHVSAAIGQIASSAGHHMAESLGHGVSKLFRGEVDRVGAVQTVSSGVTRVSKAADRAIQLLHRTVTQNKDNEAQFKFVVSADDEDFLQETPTLVGYLARCAVKASVSPMTDMEMEKESQRKGQFKRKYYELKGKTLFFRKNKSVPKNSMYSCSYKVPLDRCMGVIYFVEKDELQLNMQQDGYIERLKLYANDSEGGEDDAEEGGSSNPTLEDWLQALKQLGVPCYSWKRGAPSASPSS